MLRFGACSQLITFWFHWPFLFSPPQALPPEVKVLLPLLPALPLKLFHGLSTYQGRRVILGSGSQLLVSFSICIISCSCFPGHLHCRWGRVEVTHSALVHVYDYGQTDLHTSA